MYDVALLLQAARKLDAVHAIVVYYQDVALFLCHVVISLPIRNPTVTPYGLQRHFHSAILGLNLRCQASNPV